MVANSRSHRIHLWYIYFKVDAFYLTLPYSAILSSFLTVSKPERRLERFAKCSTVTARDPQNAHLLS